MRTGTRQFVTRAMTASLALGMLALAACAPPPAPACFPDDVEGAGSFATTTTTTSNHTFFHPVELGNEGCTHPVILWGNGTFLSPSSYSTLLNHFAAHGFIVAAANTGFAGSGVAMLQGLDILEGWNADPSSPFFGAVAVDRVGATGHSQGGGGSINAGSDPRVSATAPMQPTSVNTGSLQGPALFLSGQNDSIIPPSTVLALYNTTSHVVAAYGEAAGIGHLALNDPAYRLSIAAWFRYYLMDDARAGGTFFGDGCTLCTSPAWSDYRAKLPTS